MFPIIQVPDQARDYLEPVGTKEKFWLQGQSVLFKEGRPNTGDDWSEKIASELCELLNLPHAQYDFATWKGRKGVLSPTFIPPDARLELGNELLAKVVAEYPKTKRFGVAQHTVRRVMAILRNRRIKLPIGWTRFAAVETARDVFVGYLMFDAWIANQDRHHENWGLVVTPETTHLAPSYDHASSMGSGETDTDREDRLSPSDRRRSVERYVERAVSAFYASSTSKKPLSPLEAFYEAGKLKPQAADAWLERLRQVSLQDVASIFDQIPAERISPVASRFAQKMLEVNCQRLLALQGVWS
jgi:hypothetical protein